jgi:hypothetical protein
MSHEPHIEKVTVIFPDDGVDPDYSDPSAWSDLFETVSGERIFNIAATFYGAGMFAT